MSPTRLLTTLTIAATLLLTGVGCISIGSSTAGLSGGDGGLFKSTNKGDVWQQKVAIPTTTGERRTIGNASIASIVQDSQDPNTLYIGTTENGMYYSYDAGESWQQPAQLSRGRIPAIALNPKQKCTVYVAIENKLLKSDDCSRTWNVVYLDSRPEKFTTAVAVDAANPSVVWLANNGGDVERSADGGASWTSVKSFSNAVVRLAINNGNSQQIFVGTKVLGVWRSDDGGATWNDLSGRMKQFSGATDFYDIALGVSDPNTVVVANKYGLLRSTDAGNTWQAVDLLTPPGTTLIYSVALDPKDVNNVYYGTSTTFYRSSNGGVNWVPKKLPGSRTATVLQVDKMNPSVVYLGVTKFK